MSEESNTEGAWQQVGEQLETLGESLAAVFRAAWQRSKDRQDLEQMQSGLESMVQRIGQAVDEAGASAREEGVAEKIEKTAEAFHQAGAQTWEEAKPQLLAALDQVNAELKHLFGDSGEATDQPDEPTGE